MGTFKYRRVGHSLANPPFRAQEYSAGMATMPVQLDEEALVRGEIAQIALPKGVSLIRVKPGSDSMGDPAFHLYFEVSTDIKLTGKRASDLASLHMQLIDRVLALRLGRWPVVHFVDEA
jgi:hypothetical protein